MASAYKNIVTIVGATGDVTAYTCPAATVALVKNINMYNSHTGAVVVYSKITDSSASVTVILQKVTMATLASSSAPQTCRSRVLLFLRPETRSFSTVMLRRRFKSLRIYWSYRDATASIYPIKHRH